MFAVHYLLYTAVVALILLPIGLYLLKSYIRPAFKGALVAVCFPAFAALWGFGRARELYLRAIPLGIFDYAGVLFVLALNLTILSWGIVGLDSSIPRFTALFPIVAVALLVLHASIRAVGSNQRR